MKGVYLKKGNTKVSVVPYYRIGDLFLTTIATNPSNFLGGKWELFGPGKCLVCVDTSQTEFNSVKKSGGEKTHKLTVNEMPSHNHQYEDITGNRSLNGQFGRSGYYESESYMGVTNSVIAYADADFRMTYVGGSESHNNLQPYITCYVWIRTA